MSLSIVTIAADDLAKLIREQVEAVFTKREAETVRPVSAAQVAKQARRRPALIQAALEAGTLPGRRVGRVWHIMPKDAAAWIAGGCKI